MLETCDLQVNSKMTCFFYSVFATSVRASKVPSLKYNCHVTENINPARKRRSISISDRRRTHGRGNLRASVLFFSSSTHFFSADLWLTALFFKAHSRRHLATTTPPTSTVQYSHERASSDRTCLWVF